MPVSGVKVVVIYPRPRDEEEFERVYRDDHLPMAEAKLKGMNRLVTTKVLSSPQGRVQIYRIAEIHFAGMDTLNACLESEGGRAVIEHATKISTGGAPVLLVCEEQSYMFW